ncbi:MAG: hypothetical protein FWB88_07505 [Defluviitaleaceae bacterium]|nr:hypothetical protein [Defluviitaleaceae bacterium]MCL2239331.1 hypothetical protein [Defluviitaleaceae bacterium]
METVENSNSLSVRSRLWAWTSPWTAHGQSKERFAHTLPTNLPTPTNGRSLNSLQFPTVPTTPTTAAKQNMMIKNTKEKRLKRKEKERRTQTSVSLHSIESTVTFS